VLRRDVRLVALIDLRTLLARVLTRLLLFRGSDVPRVLLFLFGVGAGAGGCWVGLLGGGARHVGAAERAVDVGAEPGVDALDVERVDALGQQPKELAVLELAEADGTVGGAERAAGAVPRERDRLDRRLVEPHGPDVPRVVDDFFIRGVEAGAVVGGCGGRRRWGQGGLEKRLLLPPPPPHAADEEEDGEAKGEEG
jgi:hypothetical protein